MAEQAAAGIVIRHAQAGDLPAIVAIYNSTVASRSVTADLVPVSVAEREAWFAEHTPAQHPIWVVEQGGTVIGWMSLSAFHSRAAYDATAEISLYLDPAARGQGLGGRLLRFAEEAVPALGIRTLVGRVFAHNAPSVALFAKHGYARWGELPDVAELDGVRRSLLYLGRHLQ
ncbi:GNAT family N-acetyltransferase [Craterilacuibacter sp.]|uniref:GNAT family N-acetyltransferase n=1 Tax=Craterilacuibacter sp. TaxID=2870909 RepID=UPI003F37B730